MKKQIIILVMTLLPMLASADAVEIDGIFYNLNKTEYYAEVTKAPNYYEGKIVIPETVSYEGNNYIVKCIGVKAFYSCYSLTVINIPNTVSIIGNNAFYDCYNLRKVIINDIAKWCCIDFENIYSNPLTTAGHIYSGNNTEITELIIPNNVTNVKDFVFSGCSGLTSITIPNSVESIGNAAFQGCSNIKEIIVPNSVSNIGNSAFQNCYSLTGITIPNSLSSIGERTFYGCI